jgi:hypothetical protein
MKKTYTKPETTTVILRSVNHFLTTSNIELGNAYNGETVLSRESNWDEEDE